MGILFSIGAAFLFSVSQISINQGVKKLGVPTGTAVMLGSATIVTAGLAILVEKTEVLLTASAIGILLFALAGVIHFIGGWGFMNASASRIGPTRVSATTSMTPLFAALLALVSLDQSLNLYIIGGIMLIVFGIYIVSTSEE